MARLSGARVLETSGTGGALYRACALSTESRVRSTGTGRLACGALVRRPSAGNLRSVPHAGTVRYRRHPVPGLRVAAPKCWKRPVLEAPCTGPLRMPTPSAGIVRHGRRPVPNLGACRIQNLPMWCRASCMCVGAPSGIGGALYRASAPASARVEPSGTGGALYQNLCACRIQNRV